MNCEEVMELMQRDLDGDLNELETAELQSHLQDCVACRAIFKRLNVLSQDLLNNLPKVTPPYSIVDSIMPKLAELDAASPKFARQTAPLNISETKESAQTPRSNRVRRQPFGALAGVAAAVIVLVIAFINGTPNESHDASDMILYSLDNSNRAAHSDDAFDIAQQEADGGDEFVNMLGVGDADALFDTGSDEDAESSHDSYSALGGMPSDETAPRDSHFGIDESPPASFESSSEKALVTEQIKRILEKAVSPDHLYAAQVELVHSTYLISIVGADGHVLAETTLEEMIRVGNIQWEDSGNAITFTVIAEDGLKRYLFDLSTGDIKQVEP